MGAWQLQVWCGGGEGWWPLRFPFPNLRPITLTIQKLFSIAFGSSRPGLIYRCYKRKQKCRKRGRSKISFFLKRRLNFPGACGEGRGRIAHACPYLSEFCSRKSAVFTSRRPVRAFMISSQAVLLRLQLREGRRGGDRISSVCFFFSLWTWNSSIWCIVQCTRTKLNKARIF